jgi:DNA-binding winged helix-turn-helix (wHTH) protein/Tfp pilus assembly protein PilF
VAGIRYAFGEFELDPQARRLSRGGGPVSIADRHFDVLHLLVSTAGTVQSKDALVSAGWGDVAVTDNSLEQAVSALRRTLSTSASEGGRFIETVPRRGYRFTAEVTRLTARESDAALDALLAPHRAWLEGRAALETLERNQIHYARDVFERVLQSTPDQPLAHVGVANACAMQYETTRTDEAPDVAALERAVEHAREACRLDPQYGEAWATLGFVLDRTGSHLDAIAALRRAATLEPDNWRHHLRLAYVSWGEERLRAARRTLTLLPGFPLAHWLAATVHVARDVLDEADRELTAGIQTRDRQGEHVRFSGVGLHWLRGLIHLARGNSAGALDDLNRELSFESAGHLYGRECCANTWYAIGALHLRQDRFADARQAFEKAIDRVAVQPLAHVALAAVSEAAGAPRVPPGTSTFALRTMADGSAPLARAGAIEAAIWRAAVLTLRGEQAAAAEAVRTALAEAPPGNGGWLLPVEPLLNVAAQRDVWAATLERLRIRAV